MGYWLLCIACCLFALDAPKVCVAICTHNDEEVIERALSSLPSWIDAVVLCDATSSDRTVVLATLLLEKKQVPLRFFANSSALQENVTRAVQEWGWPLEEVYVFWIDPNMTFASQEKFQKKDLVADAYLIEEEGPLFHRCRERCTRLDRKGTSQNAALLEELRLRGENELFEREIQRLQKLKQTTPGNPTLSFDLAQQYKQAKRYEEAITECTLCLTLPVHPEEAWGCKYILGECYEHLGQWDKALYWYLEAHQSATDRAETILKITEHYRDLGQNDLSYIFAKYGSILPQHNNCSLVDPTFSNYKFTEDLSIVAYYTRFRKEGLAAANDLLLGKDVPWWTKDLAAQNILFYVSNLTNATYHPIDIELPLVKEGSDETYHPMNPSILTTDNGYTVICRSVNYTQKGAKSFHTNDVEGIFRTRNFLVSYGPDFTVLDKAEIVESLPRERTWALSIVQGLEDCRLFRWQDRYWFTSTTRDANPAGIPQIVLCQLEKEAFHEEIQVEQLTSLLGPDPNRCEKNWLPFLLDDSLHAIYSYEPFIVYRINEKTGECLPFIHTASKWDCTRLRGSAGPTPWKDGYLVLVHEVCFSPEGYRIYLHRFVKLNHDLEIQHISLPFTFQHQGVEYCCSMTLDLAKENLILAVGIEDHEAHICKISLKHIDSLFEGGE